MGSTHSVNAALAHINFARNCRDREFGGRVAVIRASMSRRTVGDYDPPNSPAALLRGNDIWQTRAFGVGHHWDHLGILLGLHGSDLSSVGEQAGSGHGVEGDSEGKWSFIASNGRTAF